MLFEDTLTIFAYRAPVVRMDDLISPCMRRDNSDR